MGSVGLVGLDIAVVLEVVVVVVECAVVNA